jgi:hypothetical protein
MTTQEMGFEGYAFRTNSRFGSRVRISADGEMVSVRGPRVGRWIYAFWFGMQFVLLWLAPVCLIAGILFLDWRFALLAVGLVAVQGLLGALGVAAFWELASISGVFFGVDQVATFPLSAIKEVKIGRGWARKGVRWIIPHVVPGIDQMAKGRAVSFEAPDGETGRECAYALLMWNEEDAAKLAKLLAG